MQPQFRAKKNLKIANTIDSNDNIFAATNFNLIQKAALHLTQN